jgi:RimJ/RimL family protein N-acetyltransferase
MTTIAIDSSHDPGFRLRAIDGDDLENLRLWKNANKNSFFLRRDIEPAEQEKWFEGFSSRDDDHMFIVEQAVGGNWEPIGCMGFRLLEDEGCVDAYNIIRSRKLEPASFTMADCFRTMLKYAASKYPAPPIRCKVLRENPAVAWYEKNGFSIVVSPPEYHLMELDKKTLDSVLIEVNE